MHTHIYSFCIHIYDDGMFFLVTRSIPMGPLIAALKAQHFALVSNISKLGMVYTTQGWIVPIILCWFWGLFVGCPIFDHISMRMYTDKCWGPLWAYEAARITIRVYSPAMIPGCHLTEGVDWILMKISGKSRNSANTASNQVNPGWWFQPLWKILVKWVYYSQYMEKQESCSSHHQPEPLQKTIKKHRRQIPIHWGWDHGSPRASAVHLAAWSI